MQQRLRLSMQEFPGARGRCGMLAAVLGMIVCGLASGRAGAPCDAWSAPFGSDGVDPASVAAVTTWDPDGNGPLADHLVVGGSFLSAGGLPVNRIAMWDGQQWHPLGAGIGGGASPSVFSLTTWDPDGAGDTPAKLVAAGRFTAAGGIDASNIAMWDGTNWHSLGSGSNTRINRMIAWDPDGQGPLNDQLVVGGHFTTIGGNGANRVARWDGSTWHTFGTGVSAFSGAFVAGLTTWDPDGDGPLGNCLVVGGKFTTAGSAQVLNLAYWDGLGWREVFDRTQYTSSVTGNDPTDDAIYALTTWDPDGDGPLRDQLVQGGSFGFVPVGGGFILWDIARWDGVAWQRFDPGLGGDVADFLHWDPDGDGPEPTNLVVGGSFLLGRPGQPFGQFCSGIGRWDGSNWNTFDTGMYRNGTSTGVGSLALWDADGSGPQSAHVVAGGSFTTSGANSSTDNTNGVAVWTSNRWQACSTGLRTETFADHVQSLLVLSNGPDDAGSRLLVGGQFQYSPTDTVNGIAEWREGEWHALSEGLTRTSVNLSIDVKAMVEWGPEGSGNNWPGVVVGGRFDRAGGVSVNNIARWDGLAWSSIGAGFDSTVDALLVCDTDGDGPLGDSLVAAGSFVSEASIGGPSLNGISRWDGHSWQPFGSGMNNGVACLSLWDSDGAGPSPPRLVAGGYFTIAGGIAANRIAWWDGSNWHPFDAGMDGSVQSLVASTPGPATHLGPQLIAAGGFDISGGVITNGIARWDGAMWHSMGSGVSGLPQSRIYALTEWRPSPLTSLIIATGSFDAIDGSPASNAAIWDGAGWNGIGTGVSAHASARIHSAAVWPPDGTELANRVVVGGLFSLAGGIAARDLAVVSPCFTPPSCSGDSNGDNLVNGADLSLLLGQFGGAPSPDFGADHNGDGVVNGADLSILLSAFGTSCGG